MILLCFPFQWRLTYCAYEAVALLSRKLGTIIIIVLQLFYIVQWNFVYVFPCTLDNLTQTVFIYFPSCTLSKNNIWCQSPINKLAGVSIKNMYVMCSPGPDSPATNAGQIPDHVRPDHREKYPFGLFFKCHWNSLPTKKMYTLNVWSFHSKTGLLPSPEQLLKSMTHFRKWP